MSLRIEIYGTSVTNLEVAFAFEAMPKPVPNLMGPVNGSLKRVAVMKLEPAI